MPDDLGYLLLSVLVLSSGPLLQRLAERVPRLLQSMNILVSVAAGLLVVLHILPELITSVGAIALGCAVVGLIAPTLVERRLHHLATGAHTTALILAVAGIALHGLLDGMAIAAPVGDGSSGALPLAIILHRIPAGMAVWFLVSANGSGRLATVALAAVAVATVVGFMLIELPFAGPRAIVDCFRALVAGSLLHVLLHRTHSHQDHDCSHR